MMEQLCPHGNQVLQLVYRHIVGLATLIEFNWRRSICQLLLMITTVRRAKIFLAMEVVEFKYTIITTNGRSVFPLRIMCGYIVLDWTNLFNFHNGPIADIGRSILDAIGSVSTRNLLSIALLLGRQGWTVEHTLLTLILQIKFRKTLIEIQFKIVIRRVKHFIFTVFLWVVKLLYTSASV